MCNYTKIKKTDDVQRDLLISKLAADNQRLMDENNKLQASVDYIVMKTGIDIDDEVTEDE